MKQLKHGFLPLTVTLAAVSASLLGAAHAAGPVLSAQSIIVNPTPSPVNVRVWTDRDRTGTATPNYLPGEKIRLYTSVSQDSYVYLFNVDPNGKVDLILPNRFQGGGNFIKANTTKVFPDGNDPFTFDIAAPYGVNKVLALASRTPLNIDQIATFKSQQSSFASVSVQGQGQLAQALSIVVRPVDQTTWDSAVAYYNVAQMRAAAQPVQPVSPIVTTPPRTAQALSVTVTPANPWGNAKKWETVTDTRVPMATLHADYVKRLQAEGYVLTGIKRSGNKIESKFTKAGGGKAELSLKQKGNRIEIELERK